MWNIPCNTTNDLLPPTEFSDNDELKQYWINKYKLAFNENLSLLPKWARAFHIKFYQGDGDSSSSSSTDSSSDDENAVEVSQNEDQETSSDSSESETEQDLDPDLTTTRAQNRYYLNLEDQLHFREIDEGPNDVAQQVPEFYNMSNPRGENFQLRTPMGSCSGNRD